MGISNDRSVEPRKLDGLDCNGYHPLIPANRAFKDLIDACVETPPPDCDPDVQYFFNDNYCFYFWPRDSGSCPYDGPIGCWDTSLVTDMEGAFDGKRSFN